MNITRPIIVIGAPRSGTTMLAEMLSQIPAAAVWIEPKYVWRYGRASASDDVRLADEATPKVKSYVTGRVQAFLHSHAAGLYVDKTPSNCFRIPFIEAIFPDALYLEIIRDGRAVTVSAAREWRARKPAAVFWRRLRNLDIPLREWPVYLPEIVREVLRRQLLPQSQHIWGARFPDIEDFRRANGLYTTCAMQWRQCVEHAQSSLSEIPEERRIRLEYERLCAKPELLWELLSERCPELLLPASTSLPRVPRCDVPAPQDASEEDICATERVLAPLQKILGYPTRFDSL